MAVILLRKNSCIFQSVRKQGAKYGVEIKTTAPRRTPLSQAYWYDCVKEANSEVPSKISVIDEQPLENPSENHLRITNDKSVSDCMKISDFAKSTHHLWLDSLRWLRIMFWTNVLSKSPLIDFLL